jgi:hypothetical protein
MVIEMHSTCRMLTKILEEIFICFMTEIEWGFGENGGVLVGGVGEEGRESIDGREIDVEAGMVSLGSERNGEGKRAYKNRIPSPYFGSTKAVDNGVAEYVSTSTSLITLFDARCFNIRPGRMSEFEAANLASNCILSRQIGRNTQLTQKFLIRPS